MALKRAPYLELRNGKWVKTMRYGFAPRTNPNWKQRAKQVLLSGKTDSLGLSVMEAREILGERAAKKILDSVNRGLSGKKKSNPRRKGIPSNTYKGWKLGGDYRPGREGFRADRYGVTISANSVALLKRMIDLRNADEGVRRNGSSYVVKGVSIGVPRYNFDPQKGDQFYIHGKLSTIKRRYDGDMLELVRPSNGMTDLSVSNLYQIARVPESSRFAPYDIRMRQIKTNPTPVLLRVAGRKVKAFAKRVGGKVKVFVTRQTLAKNPSLRRRVANPNWTIAKIKAANKAAGKVFFDKGHTRVATTLPKIYQGSGGVFFITKSRDPYQQTRAFSVWQFNQENGAIRHEGTHPDLQSAESSARRLAQ
jgi:hypothetical protein